MIRTSDFHRLNPLLKKKSAAVLISLFQYILIVGICFTIVFPMLFMIISSLKSASDIYNETVVWIPRSMTWNSVKSNYSDAMLLLNYWKSFLGSLKYVGITTVLQVASSCFIGYGFARFKFFGHRLLFSLVIFTIVIPPFTTLIPTFLNYKVFNPLGIFTLLRLKPPNLLETYWPFVLTCLTGFGFRSGLYIFIMKQFFEGTPRELSEAAAIDGCGTFGIFFKIMVPSATGAILTVILFSIVWQWTDVLNTTVFMSGESVLMKSLLALPGNFNNLISTGKVFFPNNRIGVDGTILTQTAVLLVLSPILLLYAVLQKYFVESIDKTGLVE